MKSQEELGAEIERLLAEERIDEAEELIEQLIPPTLEEFQRRLDEAPYDDEPVTPAQRASLDRAWEVISALRATADARPA